MNNCCFSTYLEVVCTWTLFLQFFRLTVDKHAREGVFLFSPPQPITLASNISRRFSFPYALDDLYRGNRGFGFYLEDTVAANCNILFYIPQGKYEWLPNPKVTKPLPPTKSPCLQPTLGDPEGEGSFVSASRSLVVLLFATYIVFFVIN